MYEYCGTQIHSKVDDVTSSHVTPPPNLERGACPRILRVVTDVRNQVSQLLFFLCY